MHKLAFAAILLLALTCHARSQGNQPVLRDLVLDETTPEAAIGSLGKPHKNEMRDISAWGSASKAAVGETKYRIITYKDLDGWNEVQLTFYRDKLIGTKLFPKRRKMQALELLGIYKSDFVTVEGFAKGTTLSVFDGQKDPDVPRVYPPQYFMVTAMPDRFVIAAISPASWKSIWQLGKATEKKYPGSVDSIDILSRKFETE